MGLNLASTLPIHREAVCRNTLTFSDLADLLVEFVSDLHKKRISRQ